MRFLAVLVLLSATALAQTYSEVRLIRVVDGDTVRLDLRVAPDLWYKNVSCRLLRIDAPELRAAGGAESKKALEEVLKDKTLTATARGKDRYGRFLIELIADEINVSDWLLREGHARSYTSR